MSDAELNRKLAEALGWEHLSGITRKEFCDATGNPIPFPSWVDKNGEPTTMLFEPATSSDDLRKYVLPEVERRGLDEKFAILLADHMVANRPPLGWPKQYMYICTMPPAVLAAAALKVLGGGE